MIRDCHLTIDHGVIDNGRVPALVAPSGQLLGNFPQAYTHVGLINTAATISELIEARDASFRARS